jgi:hypothetical protein
MNRANLELAAIILKGAIFILQQQLSNDEIKEILSSPANINLILGIKG